MTQKEKTSIEERIVDVLKTVYDPEIPVNIYDLGMIYKIDMQEDGTRSRLYIRRCTHESGKCGRRKDRQRKSRVRARMGSEHDERRSTC